MYLQEEVEARLEAERRLREAEASLSRLEKAVEKQVTRKKAAAAAAAAEKKEGTSHDTESRKGWN